MSERLGFPCFLDYCDDEWFDLAELHDFRRFGGVPGAAAPNPSMHGDASVECAANECRRKLSSGLRLPAL